jgi:transcriptional regulator with XRE-family HTH domain
MAKTFGQVVRQLRQERGLSVYALAQRTGLSDQAIHDLESADRQPSLDTLRRMAAALGVTLDWINERLPPVQLPEPKTGRPRGRPPKAAPAPPPAGDDGGDGPAKPKRRKGR